MRNVFDQYSQAENRVMHALMVALHEDRKLLGMFLRELVRVKPPAAPRTLTVLEQQYPGEEEPSEEDLEPRGVPDGWIVDRNGWCVLLENKVMARLSAYQIKRHRRSAERRGFKTITAVAIAPILPSSVPPDTVMLEWRKIYAWLRRHASRSPWAKRAAEFLEIAEAKLIEAEQFREGTLTMFAGFPFGRDHPFTYLEGKRVLELALAELKNRRDLRKQLKIDPKGGRGAITGRRRDAVWDVIPLASSASVKSFTNYPHLTLGVSFQGVEAMVTIPNDLIDAMRHNLTNLSEDGFQQVVKEVVKNLKPLLRKHKGAAPWFRGVQRRYPSRRAAPFIDAQIDFDLRTAIPSNGPPKAQPRWLSAAYGSFINKQGANYQIQIGVVFRYDRCPELSRSDAIDLVAASWLACKPLVDAAR